KRHPNHLSPNPLIRTRRQLSYLTVANISLVKMKRIPHVPMIWILPNFFLDETGQRLHNLPFFPLAPDPGGDISEFKLLDPRFWISMNRPLNETGLCFLVETGNSIGKDRLLSHKLDKN